eukprot:Phypoly_transcript_16990.p1 GENE.Phypoly_transcript_16990~~Phypoly_transcript_16990.p1  ORF type:complete len:212 (+),score=30.23 Phypoly_transcript_16990:98-733(+)
MSGFEDSEGEVIQSKVVLVGDAGVGKSCFMKKFVDDAFTENHVVTIGVDYKEKTVEKEKLSVKLQLWDTAGEERFRSLSTGVFKTADGCFLFYDTTESQTYKNLAQWKTQLAKFNPNMVMILVGTKLDLPDLRCVPLEDSEKLASSWGMPIFETSSKTGEGIDQAIICMTDKLTAKKGISVPKPVAIKPKKKGFTIFIKGIRGMKKDKKEG